MNTDSTVLKMGGRDIPAKKLFYEAEKLLIAKGDFYLDNLLSLAHDYSPDNMLLFTVGMLTGIILERRDIRIEIQQPLDNLRRTQIKQLIAQCKEVLQHESKFLQK